jgi:hypothetical protein
VETINPINLMLNHPTPLQNKRRRKIGRRMHSKPRSNL